MARSPVGGTSILEALVALLLLSIVIPGGWKILARSRSAGAAVALRAEGLETVRTVAWLLPEEVSQGRAVSDWWVAGPDSLVVRAFRGIALVQPGPIEGRRIHLCFRGVRSPAPEKDSVLLLGTDGVWRAHDLEDRARLSAGCPGVEDGWEEVWTLFPPPSPGVVARLFEHGSYHLSDGALRYRRGEGGRQPLTPERIDEGSFLGRWAEGGAFGWHLSLQTGPGTGPAPDEPGPISWRGRTW